MPPNAPDELLVLVDAHSLIYQVFHAIPSMTSPSGAPTNAIFGFTRDLFFLREEKRPTYLVVAFDLPGPVFRSDIYPEYKAHRKPMPDDLQLQIPQIHRLLDAFRLPRVSVEGFEADDVIATLATAASNRGCRVFICTSDKDCRQLIDDRVHLYNLRKKQALGRAELQQEWGIRPDQVVDYQTLVGDSVDNVPGVPGIGDKTAAKLLQDFGTVDNLLQNIDKVSGAKRQENLRACGEIVAISRQLVRLATDVPVPLDWDAWRLRPPDADGLLALFQEWGFRGFADQVRKQFKTGAAAPNLFAAFEGEDFAFGANAPADAPAPEPWVAEYHLVDAPEKFAAFEKQLRERKRFAVDLETTSLQPRQAEIVGLAFSWRAGEGWYLPLRGPAEDALLDSATTLDRLRPLFQNPAVAKVNQNIKYDQIVLRQHGIGLEGVVGDPMLADYLLHAGERSHNMADLSIRYLGHPVIPITDLIGKGKAQIRMDQVPTGKVALYSGEDADVAWRLCEILEPQLAEQKLRRLYDDVETPLIAVLAELEFNGIRLDVPLLERIGEELGRQIVDVEREIHAIAGHPFNVASPKQLREVLFDELKLPAQKKTGVTSEASTDQESLERLAALGHPLPRKILEHRQLSKLKGTYVDALPGLVDPGTGRVHASFNQTVAATGRLSSSDPNLQNIPVRTEQGRQIRQAFVPEPGWVLLTADYSQVELRLLAHFCGDAALRRAFAEERDVHAAVAAQIFAVPEEKVTASMRRLAKTVNFGVIYGISPFGLAARLDITKEEAAKFIDAYFARYPKVLDYQDRLLANCRASGYVGTILGRKRAITGIRPRSTYLQRNQPEREAINMEIQGSAADLMKLAMLAVFRRLRSEHRQARLLLTVHDELVVEAPFEELHAVAALLREEMTSAMQLEVPLRVDVAAGPNWLDVEELSEAA